MDSSSSTVSAQSSNPLLLLTSASYTGPHPPTEFPTTMMVRNLPADLSISELVSLLTQEGFKGLYDYVHIAGDQGVRSKSYGFINFVSPVVAMKFKTVFTGKPIQGRDILRVAEVLYAKGHGFKQNITHRINLHGTKIFLFVSGEEMPLPRDSAMVQSVADLNKPAQERLRALLTDRPDIGDMHALRLELGLTDSDSAPSPKLGASLLEPESLQRISLASSPSLFGPNPDLAAISAAVSGSSQQPSANSASAARSGAGLSTAAEERERPLHLFVFPTALVALGPEVETLEKLVGQRMRWQITAVIYGSMFCETVDALLTRAIADPSVKVAALVAPGDVAAASGDSSVLLEFLRESLNRVDVFTLVPETAAPDFQELKTQIPKLKTIPNLFTLGTTLRKLAPTPTTAATAASAAVAGVAATPVAVATQPPRKGQLVTIKKQIWPAFARNLEQGGMRPVLQSAPVGSRATVVDVHLAQAVMLLQTQNFDGTRSVGFLPMEFIDYST